MTSQAGRLWRALALCCVMFFGSTAPEQINAGEDFLQLTPDWEFVSDRVMGGVSEGTVQRATVAGRAAVRLSGQVSLANNGGFVQMGFDLNAGRAFDASEWAGIQLEVRGNGETYEIRLRTTDLTRPWQSFRAAFEGTSDWTHLRLPFSAFEAHRTDASFDPRKLRRVGVLAVGRAFEADIAVAAVGFYK